MILLQGHAVTLTFKVATQILCVHIVHIATYVHSFMRLASIVLKLSKDPDFSGQTDGRTDRQTDWLTDGRTEGKPIVPFGVNTGRGLINVDIMYHWDTKLTWGGNKNSLTLSEVDRIPSLQKESSYFLRFYFEMSSIVCDGTMISLNVQLWVYFTSVCSW